MMVERCLLPTNNELRQIFDWSHKSKVSKVRPLYRF